jgi:hypothetical protein
VTARSLEPYYKINGDRLERAYKDYLSDFRQWEQKPHASDWILLEKNMGPRLSIDETSLQEDLFTILSNKDGHGRRGTVIAAVRGTKASKEIRLRSKREAIKDQRTKQAEFRNKLEQRVKQRKYYRKKHPRRYKG